MTSPWYEGPLPPRSFRSLFKWGAPDQYKHPNRHLVRLLQNTFGISAADLAAPLDLGLDPLPADLPPTRLSPGQIAELTALVGGPENVRLDPYDRLRASYGKTMYDLIRLRRRVVENLPDAVLCPRDRADVAAVLAWCAAQKLPLYVYGGGSSVTRGFEAVRGGITLDLSAHMRRILSFNETDQTITVEAGLSGPELENALNAAPQRFGAQHAYTCGHFPQSFEFSSVGGWVVTRGAGQNSTYYGKIEDIVFSQEYVTPAGLLTTPAFPRTAAGPDLNQVMMGSEGAFGVLTAVTLRIFRRTPPAAARQFAWMFKTWPAGLSAVRELLQSECGRPSVLRLSDPEETEVGLKLYGVDHPVVDRFFNALGCKPMQKCLLLGSVDGGAPGYTRAVLREIQRICARSGAVPLSALHITRRWEKDRFRDPYLREDLQDHGILIDTLECAVTWSQLEGVHAAVRAYVKQRPQTICMTHLSHVYPQGANLYFIFIARLSDPDEYLRLQYGILETLTAAGAAVSHHHGVGKASAPWLAGMLGAPGMGVLHALKNHFDPGFILNPGGTLALDLTPEQEQKRWGLSA